MIDALTNIDRVRLALAMVDAGYPWEIEIEYVEELLSAYDDLAAPQAQPAFPLRMGWQSMSTAPKDAEIIGQDSDGRIFNLRWEPDDSGENWYDVQGDQLAYPIRWMPMPSSASPPEQPSIAIDVEKAAIALHRAVWNYTSSWEHENPKLKDHYRSQVAVVINALAKEQTEYLSGCQLRGPGECQSRGMCLSDACQHAGKVIVKRICVEAKVDGILYPAKEPI
jgi:hypothetical protein